jgi:hypothetical protein
MKIKNILAAVCGFIVGMAFLNVGIINVNANEPTPSVQSATTVQKSAAGEPGRAAVRPQGGVWNVKYITVTPVAMPAENAEGFNLFAGRILEDAMAGRPFGTGNRITALSLVQSSAPGNCWVLIRVVGVDISLSQFVVKTKSTDTGNALGSLTPFDVGCQYGPLAVLISGGEKITSGPSTRTGEEIWFFARPPLFKGGSDAVAQVDNWVGYQNSTYGDFTVTVTVSLQGKEDLNIAWTVLSTKSTPAAPFVKMGADGSISLASDADKTPRCYLIEFAATVNGPWTPVGNVSHDSPTTVFSEGNSTPQAFFKAMAQ